MDKNVNLGLCRRRTRWRRFGFEWEVILVVVSIFRVSSKETGFVLQRLEALLLLLGHQVVTKVCLVSCSTECS